MTAPLTHYLDELIAPLAEALADPHVTDIYINRAQEYWLEYTGRGTKCFVAPELDAASLNRLSRQIAAFASQGISRAHPLLAATLPARAPMVTGAPAGQFVFPLHGARVQIAMPPATRHDMAIAIRKHTARHLRLADYVSGWRDPADAANRASSGTDIDKVFALLRQNRIDDALRHAVQSRKTILVSGGTSTGKTTFLNALIAEIDNTERVILIEDTPELTQQHANSVGLVAGRNPLGESQISLDDLLTASLRMRPDRIIIGEVRGSEAFTFLRAINTGHPGSMTSIHANSPEGAIDQLTMLILQSGTTIRRDDIAHYIRQTIDIFVHLDHRSGKRYINDVAVRTANGELLRV